MSDVRTPSSLKWLINKRARLTGLFLKLYKSNDELLAKARNELKIEIKTTKTQAEGFARIGDSLITASVITLAAKVSNHAPEINGFDIFGLIFVILTSLVICIYLRKEES